jgi:sortase B
MELSFILKRNKFVNVSLDLLIFFLVCGLVYFGYNLFLEINYNRINQNIQNETSIYVRFEDKQQDDIFDDSNFPTKSIDVEDNNDATIFGPNEKFKYNSMKFIHVDFDKLRQKNEESVAWIMVPNTKINYSVVQHKDNDFYLDHNLNKDYNTAGWIFGDYRCRFDILGYNTVIYGHNRRDESMFGQLHKMLEPDRFKDKKNRYIYVTTPLKSYVFEVFSVYTTEPNNEYNLAGFETSDAFNTYEKDISQKNTIKILDGNLISGSKVLTLSTCSNNDRLVVHAQLIGSTIN